MKDITNTIGSGPDKSYKPFLRSDCQNGEFLKIYLVNLFFTILTFGIFRFWAKTRNRRYIFSRMKLLGDGFEYTGTAKELFLGFLVVMVFILLPFGILPALYAQNISVTKPELAGTIHTVQGVFFFCLFPVAIFRAYRYIASRVNWRGVRFSQVGSTFGYWWRWIVFTLALPLTGGLIYPLRHAVMSRYWVSNMRFGNQVFQTGIRAGRLYKSFLISYAIVIVGLGVSIAVFSYSFASIESEMTLPGGQLSEEALEIVGALGIGLGLLNLVVWIFAMSFYFAKYISLAISETSLNDCSFKADLGPMKLIGFQLVNLIIMAVTFGLYYPFIVSRYMAFISENLMAHGEESLEQTIQVERNELKTGEGLADALDVGAF